MCSYVHSTASTWAKHIRWNPTWQCSQLSVATCTGSPGHHSSKLGTTKYLRGWDGSQAISATFAQGGRLNIAGICRRLLLRFFCVFLGSRQPRRRAALSPRQQLFHQSCGYTLATSFWLHLSRGGFLDP